MAKAPLPISPGEALAQELLDRNMTQAELAECTAYDRPYISRVINNRYRISLPFAVALEEAGVGKARYWLVLQVEWELARSA